MQALILNSLEQENELYNAVTTSLTGELSKAGYKSKFINLRDKNIEYCNGCGYCGEKEVGVCVKKDDMTEIYPEMANSELYVFISPISFGGFDSEHKKVIDRICPLGVSCYTIHRGELHHPMRYKNPEMFLSIGILKDNFPEQEETFKLVSERLEKAFFASKAKALVFKRDTNVNIIEKNIKEAFEEMGLMS